MTDKATNPVKTYIRERTWNAFDDMAKEKALDFTSHQRDMARALADDLIRETIKSALNERHLSFTELKSFELSPKGVKTFTDEETADRNSNDPRFQPDAMEVMGYFNSIIDYHLANNLPKEVTLYLSHQESRRIMDGFKFYQATSSIRGEYSHTTFLYGGFTFTLVHL